MRRHVVSMKVTGSDNMSDGKSLHEIVGESSYQKRMCVCVGGGCVLLFSHP